MISYQSRAIALVKPLVTQTALQIQFRNVRIEKTVPKSLKKNGISIKPKRPLVTYFRFMDEIRPSLKFENPNLRTAELARIMAMMWNSMDASSKQKFVQEYKIEKTKYLDEVIKYKAQQEKIRLLERPSRPINSFIRYLKIQTDRQPNEEYKNYVKRVSIRWKSLTEIERVKYKTPMEDKMNYKKDMYLWQANRWKLYQYDATDCDLFKKSTKLSDHTSLSLYELSSSHRTISAQTTLNEIGLKRRDGGDTGDLDYITKQLSDKVTKVIEKISNKSKKILARIKIVFNFKI